MTHWLARRACRSLTSQRKVAVRPGASTARFAEDAPSLRAQLIAAALRVEHYEMAGYGSARTFAQQCGRKDVADLLQQTLNEEGNADKKLTEIGERSINVRAARA